MGGGSSKECLTLSEGDLSFLERTTKMAREEIQVWHQGFLKDCPEGELSRDHFVSMYSQMFPGGNPTAFSENVFRTFDTNSSGTIDFREFMLALHVTSNGSPEEKLAWAFKMYDIDGNGVVEFNEMKRVVSAVYQMLGSDGHLGKSQELFTKLDKNADGLISQEEFIEIIKKDRSLLDVLQGKSY